jgi:hypothetical protein
VLSYTKSQKGSVQSYTTLSIRLNKSPSRFTLKLHKTLSSFSNKLYTVYIKLQIIWVSSYKHNILNRFSIKLYT